MFQAKLSREQVSCMREKKSVIFFSFFSTIRHSNHFFSARRILYLPFGFISANISSSLFFRSMTAVKGGINFL